MPRQVPTPRTVEIPSAEAVAKERERLQYKKKYCPSGNGARMSGW